MVEERGGREVEEHGEEEEEEEKKEGKEEEAFSTLNAGTKKRRKTSPETEVH